MSFTRALKRRLLRNKAKKASPKRVAEQAMKLEQLEPRLLLSGSPVSVGGKYA